MFLWLRCRVASRAPRRSLDDPPSARNGGRDRGWRWVRGPSCPPAANRIRRAAFHLVRPARHLMGHEGSPTFGPSKGRSENDLHARRPMPTGRQSRRDYFVPARAPRSSDVDPLAKRSPLPPAPILPGAPTGLVRIRRWLTPRFPAGGCGGLGVRLTLSEVECRRRICFMPRGHLAPLPGSPDAGPPTPALLGVRDHARRPAHNLTQLAESIGLDGLNRPSPLARVGFLPRNPPPPPLPKPDMALTNFERFLGTPYGLASAPPLGCVAVVRPL